MNVTFLRIAFALLGIGSLSRAGAAESTPAVPAAAPEAGSNHGKVDLNTADISALEAIPEIGTNFANAVVAARPFKSVDDVNRVLKTTPEKLAELRRKVTASPVKSVTPPPSDKSPTESVKPPATNLGTATDRKEVTERYDRATERREAEKPAPKK